MRIKRKTGRRWVRLVVGFIAMSGCFWLLFGVVFGVKRVVGDDLAPDLRDGDLVVFERLSMPRKEEIIIWPDGQMGRWNGEGDTIGRIVALWRGRGI